MVQREFTTLGISANTDTFVRQRRGIGSSPGIYLTLETNKQKFIKTLSLMRRGSTAAEVKTSKTADTVTKNE